MRVWIVDHTVQIGMEKCLVILGVRLCSLTPCGTCMGHEDVEPVSLFPLKRSDGEIVWQQLEQTIEKTGIPGEIIGDHGTQQGLRSFVIRRLVIYMKT